MKDQGILVGTTVLPDTEWCRRDSNAWWDPAKPEDFYQLAERAPRVDILCGHWTAGEAGVESIEDDGPRVVQIMKRRMSTKDPTKRLRVSIQFVIGACKPEDEYAPVWQTMNLDRYAAIHVGRREVYSRSIGVEVVSAGVDGQANVRNRSRTTADLLGRVREVLEFYPGQLRSWARLANVLTREDLSHGISIPRRVPSVAGALVTRRFARQEQRTWRGAMEHYLIDSTTKIDAGSLLLRALLDDGWEGAIP